MFEASLSLVATCRKSGSGSSVEAKNRQHNAGESYDNCSEHFWVQLNT
jgi:hypothetical protein